MNPLFAVLKLPFARTAQQIAFHWSPWITDLQIPLYSYNFLQVCCWRLGNPTSTGCDLLPWTAFQVYNFSFRFTVVLCAYREKVTGLSCVIYVVLPLEKGSRSALEWFGLKLLFGAPCFGTALVQCVKWLHPLHRVQPITWHRMGLCKCHQATFPLISIV